MYSSQATWQPFNLSHCIETHITHLLGHAGQLSQTYFTHLTPILTPRNQPLTVNRQWPPLRESRMSRHTSFSTRQKTESAAMHSLFLGTYTVNGSTRPSNQSNFVFLLCRKCWNQSSLKCDSWICYHEAHVTLVKLAWHARSHFCFLLKRYVVWMISAQNPLYIALWDA